MNIDFTRRDEILGITQPENEWPFYYMRIDDCPAHTAYTLLYEQFIDPQGTQNDSPAASTLIEFALRWHLSLEAYAIPFTRPDYRVSIEGIHGEKPQDEKFNEEWNELVKLADELTDDNEYVRAWWD